MFANTQMMGLSAQPDMMKTYMDITSARKKHDPDMLIKNGPEYFKSVTALQKDLDTLELQVLSNLAKARTSLKVCHTQRPKLEKQLGQLKSTGKLLEGHVAAAIKAIKAGDTKKLGVIAKKAIKDGSTYLKLLKTSADCAKTITRNFDDAHKMLTTTQSVTAKLVPSQPKVLLLAP